MALLLCSDGILLDGWPYSCREKLATSLTSEQVTELRGWPYSCREELGKLTSERISELRAGCRVRRFVQAASMTPRQIDALFDRPKRWHTMSRLGKRLVVFNLVPQAIALDLGERDLALALQNCPTREAFFLRLVRQPAPLAPLVVES